MAQQAAVSVETSATELVAADDKRQTGSNGIIYVHNAGSTDIYVGDAEVTTATGIPVASGKTEPFRAVNGHGLFGIVASGTESARYLIR